MEKRMKIDELMGLIDSLKIDKEEFTCLSSGALTIRGILEDAGDLDIAVSEKGYNQLSQNYKLKHKDNGCFIVNDKVEGVIDEKTQLTKEKVGDIYLQNIYEYLVFIKNSDKPKDIARIPLVEEYIEKREQKSKEKEIEI